MPEFDPIKIFKRMWSMRRWGQVLVVATILATAFAILSPFSWFSGTHYKVAIFTVIAFAVIMWVILILCDLITTSRLKRDLGKLISKGEWITARLTYYTEADIDRYDTKIREWDESIEKVLRGMEYEHSWKSDVGLTNPENESQFAGLKKFLVVDSNYMYRRLTQLKKLGIVYETNFLYSKLSDFISLRSVSLNRYGLLRLLNRHSSSSR